MTEIERFNILNNKDIPIEVWDYLKTLFDGLNIEIIGDYEGKLFELIDVKGFVSAGEIKEYFYNYYTNPPKRKTYYSNPEEEERINAFMERIFGKKENEEYSVEIHDQEDPFAPMYRNGSSYKRVEFDEDKKVKKLTVHYYMNA